MHRLPHWSWRTGPDVHMDLYTFMCSDQKGSVLWEWAGVATLTRFYSTYFTNGRLWLLPGRRIHSTCTRVRWVNQYYPQLHLPKESWNPINVKCSHVPRGECGKYGLHLKHCLRRRSTDTYWRDWSPFIFLFIYIAKTRIGLTLRRNVQGMIVVLQTDMLRVLTEC